MSEAQQTGFVIKLLYESVDVEPRWVMAGAGRGLGSRENATVFPDRRAAESEAKLWKTLATTGFSVVVEPA
jgi:hypothetical protein